MRKIVIGILLLLALSMPVSAMDFTAPTAPEEVEDLISMEQQSFGADLWGIIKSAIGSIGPELASAAGNCLAMVAVVLLTSLLSGFPGNSKMAARLVCTLALGMLLLGQMNSMVALGAETVKKLSDYGKLLLPVMTGALAAQGGTTSATALYAGTAVFDALLSSLVANLLVPMTYLFMALAIANSATGQELLKKLRDFTKWLMTWGLKIVLYVFTGYLGITGVISGTADAAVVKATKLTISGMIPVVGGILSDASEAVVLGAGVMKSAVGVTGLLVIGAIWIMPFLQIGVQYLLLKLTAAICSVFGVKEASELMSDFSSVMGLLLGMTGTVCFLLLVSTICFMKGMG